MIFRKWGGGGSKAVWNFSKNSSLLEMPPFPKKAASPEPLRKQERGEDPVLSDGTPTLTYTLGQRQASSWKKWRQVDLPPDWRPNQPGWSNGSPAGIRFKLQGSGNAMVRGHQVHLRVSSWSCEEQLPSIVAIGALDWSGTADHQPHHPIRTKHSHPTLPNVERLESHWCCSFCFSSPEQLNRWPWLTDWLTKDFTTWQEKSDPRDLWPMRHLITVMEKIFLNFVDNFYKFWFFYHFDIFWNNVDDLWLFVKMLKIFDKFDNLCQFWHC